MSKRKYVYSQEVQVQPGQMSGLRHGVRMCKDAHLMEEKVIRRWWIVLRWD